MTICAAFASRASVRLYNFAITAVLFNLSPFRTHFIHYVRITSLVVISYFIASSALAPISGVRPCLLTNCKRMSQSFCVECLSHSMGKLTKCFKSTANWLSDAKLADWSQISWVKLKRAHFRSSKITAYRTQYQRKFDKSQKKTVRRKITGP